MSLRTAVLVLSLSLSSSALAAEVAKVNGVAIPSERVDLLVKDLVTRGAKDTPEVRKNVRDELIHQEMVAQAAQARGLEKDPKVAQRLELARQQVLVDAYMQDYLAKNPVPDAEVKAEYEKLKKAASGKEYRARHILVSTEAEANDVLAQLAKGKNFAELAKARSKDKGTAARGGDMGWQRAEYLMDEFAAALVKMKVGETSKAPVKTQAGWSLIRLESTQNTKVPTYDQSREEIRRRMGQARFGQHLGELRATASVSAP